ncbi:MAG: methyltransferase domain-containing protein [Rhodospirillales bacterium]|nr:methyltransferase domain-containing protein [Rhodospirillales bacterium]
MKTMPKIEDVAQYWGRAPLLSHEIATPGSDVYFHRLNEAKVTDSDRFAFAYWDFDGFAGKKVLDIGCGPGWVTVQYAQGGATVSSVDLTDRAVDLAKQHCALRGVQAEIRQGNAESLPFDDRVFDLVVASGVLHHTPDVQKAFSEAFRVTRAGGRGKITLYRKGIAHHLFIFGLTMRIMRLLGMRHPGADLASNSSDVDDFIRRYDGDGNPVGVGKTDKAWAADLRDAGWIVEGHEIHFFPRRFLPMAAWMPVWMHRICDRCFGTMVYFHLIRPDD